jgi:hypothetical protein
MFILFQWIFLGVACIAIAGGVTLKIKKSWSGRTLLWWCLFWVLATLVTLFPNSASQVAETLGIGRGVDVIIYAALTLLFGLLFRAEVRFDRLEKQITILVREIALNRTEK